MINQVSMTFENGVCVLNGDLDFSNVVRVYEQALPQLNTDVLVFNFAGLKTSNSAGLALIIEWMRRAKALSKRIEFRNVSSKLQSIAKAAGLADVIPIV